VKRDIEFAEDVEEREAANVVWQEAKMTAEDETVCDEHREHFIDCSAMDQAKRIVLVMWSCLANDLDPSVAYENMSCR